MFFRKKGNQKDKSNKSRRSSQSSIGSRSRRSSQSSIGSKSSKGKNSSTSSRGIRKKEKLPNRNFLTQSCDDGLCGFYAYYHFTDGAKNLNGLIKQAKDYFPKHANKKDPLITDKKTWDDTIDTGIYPQLLAEVFNLNYIIDFNKGLNTVLKKSRFIVAAQSPNGHFYAFLKDRKGGIWWNYDSLRRKTPEKIGDERAVKDFLSEKKLYGFLY